MHTHELLLANTHDTYEYGKKLAKLLAASKALILLSGDLGAGKTTCAQGFLQQLVPDQAITSPTYSYMNIYDALVPIFHFDLYRINSQDELEELGLWEHLLDTRALRLVEWPEHALGIENHADIHVRFDIKESFRHVQTSYFKSIEGIT
jgi:tRNA threonylcarbamoyl adenosine modification protein YjeE